jgi:WhiB family transcriptional regulator, redox-sensing transcriptional regulator
MHIVVPCFRTGPKAHNPGVPARVPSQSRPDLTETAPFADPGCGTGWQHDAACLDYAGEVDFFPARGESVRDAKAVCAACRVREECLEFALRTKVAHGVWGGLSERERRRLRRERHRALRRHAPARDTDADTG